MNLASLGTDETEYGELNESDLSDIWVTATGVVACNSGLITCILDEKIHWFAYHEQKATDAIGGVVDAFTSWYESVREGDNFLHSHTKFGSKTELQDLLGSTYRETISIGIKKTQGTDYIKLDDFKQKSISYNFTHDRILINDGEWNDYWKKLLEKEPARTNKKSKSNCNIF